MTDAVLTPDPVLAPDPVLTPPAGAPAAPPDLTVSQHVLLAARDLEDAGHTPFTAEALAVAAWRRCPDRLGLRGFRDQYPDSNAVYTLLMGGRGLPARGWMTKTGPKEYALTARGRAETDRIPAGDGSPLRRRRLPRPRPDRALGARLAALVGSAARRRHAQGLGALTTWPEALAFWGLTDGDRGAAVDAALGRVPAALDAAGELLVNGAVELDGGQCVDASALATVRRTHHALIDLFGRRLADLRRGGRP